MNDVLRFIYKVRRVAADSETACRSRGNVTFQLGLDSLELITAVSKSIELGLDPTKSWPIFRESGISQALVELNAIKAKIIRS